MCVVIIEGVSEGGGKSGVFPVGFIVVCLGVDDDVEELHLKDVLVPDLVSGPLNEVEEEGVSSVDDLLFIVDFGLDD